MVRTGVEGGYSFKMVHRGRLSSKGVPFSGLKYMKGENDLKGQKYTSTTFFFYQVYLVRFASEFLFTITEVCCAFGLANGP